MKVKVVSVDPNRPVQIGAEQYGYWCRFQTPEVSGEAILVSLPDGPDGLVDGCTIEVEFSNYFGSLSDFRLVSSSEIPRIECLSEPGGYAVIGTVMDVQSYVRVGGWLFHLDQVLMNYLFPDEGQRVSFTIHYLCLWDITRGIELLKSLGPFRSLFVRDDGVRIEVPLDLVHLQPKGSASIALDSISAAIQANDWEPYAVKLLQNPHWLFHLTAGCAVLMKPSDEVLPALWDAIDAGSWVAPQLAVVAYFLDAAFPEHASARVAVGCPVVFPGGLDTSEIHERSVSGDPERESAKNLATLLFLCSLVTELSSWYEEARESPEVVAQLRKDIDRSAAFTEKWLKDITDLFKERGTTLSPAHLKKL